MRFFLKLGIVLLATGLACSTPSPSDVDTSNSATSLTGGQCDFPGPARSSPLTSKVVVLGCEHLGLYELSPDGPLPLDPEGRLSPESFTWLDDEHVLVASADLATPDGESWLVTLRVPSGDVVERTRLEDGLAVDLNAQLVVEGNRLIAPAFAPGSRLTDLVSIDLESGEHHWLMRTPQVGEKAMLPVEGGYLVARTDSSGQGWIDYLPSLDEDPIRVATGIDVDTLQAIGETVMVGGAKVGSEVGEFSVWSGTVADLPTGLELGEVEGVDGRWPFSESDGSLLLTQIAGLPSQTGEVLRIVDPPIGEG